MTIILGKLKLKTLLLGLLTPLAAMGQSVEITVSNPTKAQRMEVVEVNASALFQKLGRPFGTPLVVKNAYGQQQTWQLTADSLLLIEAAVYPEKRVSYTVTAGVPHPMRRYVDGQLYAWRVDDFTWENDKMAYRAYGPALQRTGEKAYGFDVWLKSVPHLVVADRYAFVHQTNARADKLRRLGWKAEADSIALEASLHLDHGNGMDCYSVGPSLGCGTPALMVGDSIVMPYCYSTYRVIDNGPLRFTAEFVYPPVSIDGQADVVEHRLVSLDKGSYFNRLTVWYEHLKHPMKFCAGLVIHTEDPSTAVLGKHYIQYADPTDSPEKHGIQIYVAALFPYGKFTTKRLNAAQKAGNIAGHLLGISTLYKDKQTYYMGAGWAGSGVRNQAMWQQEIDTFLHNVANPLQIEF